LYYVKFDSVLQVYLSPCRIRRRGQGLG